MNKKILLITISIIWIIIEILLEGSIIDKISNTGFEPLENITFILAIITLILGIFIEVPENVKIDNTKKIIKYKILKTIGYLPFVGILLFGIFSMFNGFEFFGRSYGLEALFWSVILWSIYIWPIYLVGLILIIKSNKKIKQIESCDNNEL